MNSLDEIDAFLDDEFEERFDFDDIIIDFTNEDDAIEDFQSQFTEYYNSGNDYVDLGEIKQLLNFDKTMKILEYLRDKFDEIGDDWELCKFGDNILKTYTYFYMMENHYGRYYGEIEHYFAQRAEAEAEEEEEEEEEEPEPELPPAQ